MFISTPVLAAIKRLASRDATRTEADIQADVYSLLTGGGLSLELDQVARLEVQVGDGTRRRIDVEIGHCVIEVKKDLRLAGVQKDAVEQLTGYVKTQTMRLGSRYVGVLTDGTTWTLFQLLGQANSRLVPVAELVLNESAPDAERLVVWLESILATQEKVLPRPEEIDRRLGAESPAHKLDFVTLKSLYLNAQKVPEVAIKKDLWAKLLRTAFGKAFTDDPNLFVNHTLLVLTAEVIAHAVVGFDVSGAGDLTPQQLARGTAFHGALIHGVVESDFFDWVLDVDGGPEFITELARRVARFDWTAVEHDVLKVLYESVINQNDRKKLGEYYTPDWLAQQMVESTVTAPLNEKVLDPSCGSGTFVFHAVRTFLDAATAAGMSNGNAVSAVTEHVFGMDVHPVAVTLARVTYLLAIGRERITAEDRGDITIPVYLGDSVQWEQRTDLLSDEDTVTIATTGDDLVGGGGGGLFGDDLIFPRSVVHDAGNFDRLVSAMADKAQEPSKKSSGDLIRSTLNQRGVHPDDFPTLIETFDTMRRLHDTGRDHIWGYYVRNLIRPLWLSETAHRVDVLIGNPPWLRFSEMTDTMQERYKKLAKDRDLLTGGLGASARDLSTLFVVRSIELYLRNEGAFSFVMPHGTMTRKPHDGFRSGRWSVKFDDKLNAAFDRSWDLEKVNTGFPNHACVVRGVRAGAAKKMSAEVESWVGRLRKTNVDWSVASQKITRSSGSVSVLSSDKLPDASIYKKRFRDGAILYPRALMFVTKSSGGPLGAGAGRVMVNARRTTSEKVPWKSIRSMSGPVEKSFVRRVHLGETVVPYRALSPLDAVIPMTGKGILDVSEIEHYPALAEWWKDVESLWEANKKKSDKSAFLKRIDYHGQLTAQTTPATQRVVYTKAGNAIAAARISDPECIIDHKLYWAPVSGTAEARYLVGILNSQVLLDRVRPLQAIGLFGPRDFDKHVFSLPIPAYDVGNSDHVLLAETVAECEETVAALVFSEGQDFKKSRKIVRMALADCGLSKQIEETVARVIPKITV